MLIYQKEKLHSHGEQLDLLVLINSLLGLCSFTIHDPTIRDPTIFAENRFLKNTSTWLLLRSKFYSEFDSMFCLHKIRILQKGFSQLSFTWSVKWWVSLKLWNNHSRDWINNFPFSSRHQAASHCSGCQTIWKQTTSKYF